MREHRKKILKIDVKSAFQGNTVRCASAWSLGYRLALNAKKVRCFLFYPNLFNELVTMTFCKFHLFTLVSLSTFLNALKAMKYSRGEAFTYLLQLSKTVQ